MQWISQSSCHCSGTANPPAAGNILVSSGYGAFARKPYVEISWRQNDEVRNLQITPENAQEIARNLFACAEAAVMDARVVKFLTEQLGQSIETAAQILIEFRELRAGLESQ